MFLDYFLHDSLRTFFDGRLWGDFDELVSLCESCDEVDICDVFISEGSE